MFLFNIVAFTRIFQRKCLQESKDPHEKDSITRNIKWPSQVRYNKDLFTNAATPIFCIFICIGIYLTASNAMEFSVGKNHHYSIQCPLEIATLDIAAALSIATSTPVT